MLNSVIDDCFFFPMQQPVRCVVWLVYEMLSTLKQRDSAVYPAPEAIPPILKRPVYWQDFR